MAKKSINNDEVKPRDGLDNTGTQGFDSLSDDAFTGSSKKDDKNTNAQSGTGSSSDDFFDVDEEE